MNRISSAIFLALLALIAAGCAATTPNQDPVGAEFPSVSGTSLDGQSLRVPEDLVEPTILIVGYEQDSQFDIDRWLLGMMQLQTPGVAMLELPTIDSSFARLIADRIDSGMRSGIPEEDWGSVVTIYDDAASVVALTGNENPRNARVILVEPGTGEVLWFHDRGYSAAKVQELDATVRALADREGNVFEERRHLVGEMTESRFVLSFHPDDDTTAFWGSGPAVASALRVAMSLASDGAITPRACGPTRLESVPAGRTELAARTRRLR